MEDGRWMDEEGECRGSLRLALREHVLNER